MSNVVYIAIVLAYNFLGCNCARILGIFPTPSISHQLAFRPLIQELVNRGHEVTIVTTDPAPKGLTPNLTVIDVHEASYSVKTNNISANNRNNVKVIDQIKYVCTRMRVVFDSQLNDKHVKELLKSQKEFDLLLIEEFYRPALGYSHVFKAPVILVSSFGAFPHTYDTLGAPTQPVLYPFFMQQRIYDLNYIEETSSVLSDFDWKNFMGSLEDAEHDLMKKHFGEDVPSYEKLYENVQMLFLNVHDIWTDNLPLPFSIKNIGGLLKNTEKSLSNDLKSYLEASIHGVIYVSFGTNISPSFLSTEKIKLMMNVLCKMPYEILFKWDSDQFPGQYPGIKFSKWFPQSDLLKHPNVKLFITQAGKQSTDEAIEAGVPLLALPIFADQFYNAEKYIRHGIGLKLDLNSLEEELFNRSVYEITGNLSYRRNILKLRNRIEVQHSSLKMAGFWSEYVIQNGARHLQAPSRGQNWREYYEIDLILMVLLALLLIFYVSVVIFKRIIYFDTNRINIK